MRILRVKIRESTIAGFGAFAKECIRKGKRFKLQREPPVFSDGEDASWIYVNHRCKKPNLAIEIVSGQKNISNNSFRSLEDIRNGDELTVNYIDLDWDVHLLVVMYNGCRCSDCKIHAVV